MAGDEQPWIQRHQFIQRLQPESRVGVADVGHPALENQVTGKQHAIFHHKHGKVFFGMSGTDMAQPEVDAAQFEIGISG